jgi:L-2-hydroxyglutarate oxidase
MEAPTMAGGSGWRTYDVAVIGGGLVGLSAAWAMAKRFPQASIALMEKEPGWARHQSGHNSGVIHSGIYYKPGSLKARYAQDGGATLVELCQEHGVRHEICGKVLVATEQGELGQLEILYRRGLENGLEVEKLNPEELRKVEPHVRGLAGIWVPSAGIVDYAAVARLLARLVEKSGGTLLPGAAVGRIVGRSDSIVMDTGPGPMVHASLLVNCAGLHSDRIAALCGVDPGMKIVPFRGEYYVLRRERRHLVRNLIYPVPDPKFPFLGVHFTRTVDGEVEAGPNAVLGLSREAYAKTDVNVRDLLETLGYPAFWRLATAHWRTGLAEVRRSLSRRGFARDLQKLVPAVGEKDLVPAPAGVRAQAVSRDGRLVDDFVIVEGERSIHVCNAPSPAATACLPIGEAIAVRAGQRLG